MITEIIEILPTQLDNFSQNNINKAVELLVSGEVVAFPTETVYGLGANALDETAVAKIFLAKGRPSDNPLIVHIGTMADINQLIDINRYTDVIKNRLQILADNFWPGPLTCILPANTDIARNVTAGLDTVGVRIPNHPVALKLLQQVKLPIAAPSANTSGKPSPTTATHVFKDLAGKIPLIVDGGQTDVGVESTVIDLTSEIPIILRPGGITIEQLQSVLGQVSIDPAIDIFTSEIQPKSPGMKYTHYAPEADVTVFSKDSIHKVIDIKVRTKHTKKTGIICSQQTYYKLINDDAKFDYIKIHDNNPTQVAGNLYNWLREIDELSIGEVFIEAIENDGLGYAVMNRIIKAAGGKQI